MPTVPKAPLAGKATSSTTAAKAPSPAAAAAGKTPAASAAGGKAPTGSKAPIGGKAPSAAAAKAPSAAASSAKAPSAAAAAKAAPAKAAPAKAAAPQPAQQAASAPLPAALPPPPPQRTPEELAAEHARLNGPCTIRYNHYKKTLAVAGGEVTSAAIDEELALSFVFKHCSLHLVEEEEGAGGRGGGSAPTGEGAARERWVPERPLPPLPVGEGGEEGGTCASAAFSVQAGRTYWALVQEDAAEKAAAEARQAAYAATRSAGGGGGGSEGEDHKIVKEKLEGCSCIWGNPCQTAYGCEDWGGRFELAKRHGWKG